MSDLAGLDIGWFKGATRDNPIHDALCEMNRRGQKTKAGFYDYDENRKPIPSDITKKIIRDITRVEPVTMAREQIIDACIYPMVNQVVKILKEKKPTAPLISILFGLTVMDGQRTKAVQSITLIQLVQTQFLKR